MKKLIRKKAQLFIWLGVLVVVMGLSIFANRFLLDKKVGDPEKFDLNAVDEQEDPTSLKFPDFTLNDLEGNPVSLSDFTGKVVVLNFWASWCPPCKAEMPELQALHNEFATDNNAVLIGINLADGVRETKDKAINFLNQNGYTFTNLIDEETSFAISLGVPSIPTTYILDRTGHVYDKILGATTKSRILQSVNEVN